MPRARGDRDALRERDARRARRARAGSGRAGGGRRPAPLSSRCARRRGSGRSSRRRTSARAPACSSRTRAARSATRTLRRSSWRRRERSSRSSARRRTSRGSTRSRRRQRGGRHGLTARELEVLRLVAAGKSNREIAADARHQRAHRRPARAEHLREARRLLAHGRERRSRSSTTSSDVRVVRNDHAACRQRVGGSARCASSCRACPYRRLHDDEGGRRWRRRAEQIRDRHRRRRPGRARDRLPPDASAGARS